MAKYRLLAPHVTSDGQLLEEGTEVGDETTYPWKNPDGSDMRPSTQMYGLDEAGEAAVLEVWQGLYGRAPSWADPPNEAVEAARKAESDAQQALDDGSTPVSPEQARERAMAKLEDQLMTDAPTPRETVMAERMRRVERSSTATASPTRGGVVAPAPGHIAEGNQPPPAGR